MSARDEWLSTTEPGLSADSFFTFLFFFFIFLLLKKSDRTVS